jgi:hypothetical protein
MLVGESGGERFMYSARTDTVSDAQHRPTTLSVVLNQNCPGLDSAKEESMIRKTKEGYRVLSEKGKNLGGPYKSKAQAEKRLRQVEFFKHRKG